MSLTIKQQQEHDMDGMEMGVPEEGLTPSAGIGVTSISIIVNLFGLLVIAESYVLLPSTLDFGVDISAARKQSLEHEDILIPSYGCGFEYRFIAQVNIVACAIPSRPGLRVVHDGSRMPILKIAHQCCLIGWGWDIMRMDIYCPLTGNQEGFEGRFFHYALGRVTAFDVCRSLMTTG
ncbi:predicted protein [Lichtheimia corymbifera JMRC:FSU:9682]|uniref:Uncharacterized protein n=1 Tax=Lichtheimia corymbifera JMRC:FSU:9682 TaxID=1263082 RepID=A0A068SET9_9FUNG|nr:predicted protein [Lichtheimia corymbifera JMRC:FSU:9682]